MPVSFFYFTDSMAVLHEVGVYLHSVGELRFIDLPRVFLGGLRRFIRSPHRFAVAGRAQLARAAGSSGSPHRENYFDTMGRRGAVGGAC
jgi:hypothetical protein